MRDVIDFAKWIKTNVINEAHFSAVSQQKQLSGISYWVNAITDDRPWGTRAVRNQHGKFSSDTEPGIPCAAHNWPILAVRLFDSQQHLDRMRVFDVEFTAEQQIEGPSALSWSGRFCEGSDAAFIVHSLPLRF